MTVRWPARWPRRYGVAFIALAAGWLLRGAHLPGAPVVIPGLVPTALDVGRGGVFHVCDSGNKCLWRVAGSRKWLLAGANHPASYIREWDSVDVCVGVDGTVYLADRYLYAIGTDEPAELICSRLPELLVCSGVGSHSTPGEVYASLETPSLVVKVHDGNALARVAGTGEDGFSGDGGPASSARLSLPGDVAGYLDGSILIADTLNCRVRRVTKDGIIRTVAGDGVLGYSGDGGPATRAAIGGPSSLATGSAGEFFLVGGAYCFVRRVDRSGIITTVAGAGWQGRGADGVPATQVALTGPLRVATDPAGALYIADAGRRCVSIVAPNGLIVTRLSGGRLPVR